MLERLRQTPDLMRGVALVALFSFLLFCAPRPAAAETTAGSPAPVEVSLTAEELQLLSDNPAMMQSAGGDIDDTAGFVFGALVVVGMIIIIGVAVGGSGGI